MFPTLKEGDVILYDPQAYAHKMPVAGDVVIAIHPARSDLRIVKRIENITP